VIALRNRPVLKPVTTANDQGEIDDDVETVHGRESLLFLASPWSRKRARDRKIVDIKELASLPRCLLSDLFDVSKEIIRITGVNVNEI